MRLIRLLFSSDLLLPLLLLITYIVFLVLIRGVIPTGDELVDAFASLYQKYGYEIIFFSAFLESLVLVNFFVPGQIGMALGVIFAKTGQTEFPLVVLFVSLGSLLGFIIDFILGYFGFSDIFNKLGYGYLLKKGREQLIKFGKRGLALSFVHITIAAFSSLSAGTLKMNWFTFALIASISTLFWVTVWSIVIYLLGDVILLVFRRYTFLILLLGITILFLGRIKNVRR
jgi:membrane protein DedA with SNARE-associated domain